MKYIVVIFGIIILFALLECLRENLTFRITHYFVGASKLNGLKRERKVVVLSDLHNQSYGKQNEKLLQVIRSEKPDLILIAGDMLIGKAGTPVDSAKEFVSKLPEICDVYYGNGNHEQRMKEDTDRYGDAYMLYKEGLEKNGVRFLENEKAEIEWDEHSIEIYGLEIPADRYKKIEKVELAVSEVEACIGQADREKYEILIAHNPMFAPTYLKWGADLTLSGHLHGGVVRIPFLGGIISPQLKLFPKYSGELTKEGEQAVVVSKGLGTHTIRIRLFNPAEMIVLHIGGKDRS